MKEIMEEYGGSLLDMVAALFLIGLLTAAFADTGALFTFISVWQQAAL